MLVAGNGIDPAEFEAFDGQTDRDPHRCVYTSSYDRGLEVLSRFGPRSVEPFLMRRCTCSTGGTSSMHGWCRGLWLRAAAWKAHMVRSRAFARGRRQPRSCPPATTGRGDISGGRARVSIDVSGGVLHLVDQGDGGWSVPSHVGLCCARLVQPVGDERIADDPTRIDEFVSVYRDALVDVLGRGEPPYRKQMMRVRPGTRSPGRVPPLVRRIQQGAHALRWRQGAALAGSSRAGQSATSTSWQSPTANRDLLDAVTGLAQRSSTRGV